MKTRQARPMWAWFSIGAAATLLAACGGGGDGGASPGAGGPGPGTPPPEALRTSAAIDGLVIADPVVTLDPADGSRSFVTVQMLTQGQVRSISTESVTTANVAAMRAPLTRGALVAYEKHATREGFVKLATNTAQTFTTIYRTHVSGRNFTFDTSKYGQELPPGDGQLGRMAAAGWVYGKNMDAKTITVGDGAIVTRDMAGRAYSQPIKRYEEAYNISPDVVVYNVNTADFSQSTVSTLADVPVTADYKYSTTSRQQAYFVFDGSHRDAERAKVTAIYYLTPQSVTTGKPYFDLGNNSSMLDNLGVVPASESSVYAGVRYNDIPYVNTNYEQGTEPFEIVKDTLYSVGDNEVTIYVIKSGDRLMMIDAGWPTLGYQYWKNMEAVGLDPRKITDLMLTHGHSDHNGTAQELITMIENAGGSVTVWAAQEENRGLATDAQGNTWNKPAAVSATHYIQGKTSVFYEWDKIYDFGNFRMRWVLTPGHTVGTASFFLDLVEPQTYRPLTFVYQGGYGWSPLRNATNATGWQRLQMMHTLSYLQQIGNDPILLPQHTDMGFLLEAYQAVKAFNRDPANASNQKTVLDALTTTTGGIAEFENVMEKRYQSFADPRSDNFMSNWKSVTTYGPYKPGRESGLTGVGVTLKDGGKIIRGNNRNWGVNANFPLLRNGIVFAAESYMHDPGAYYVQFYADVLDDATYQGFMPQGYTQTVAGQSFTYTGGPIESIYPGVGTPEIIRTQRLNSLAEAQAVLANVRQGGTYRVDLTRTSNIVVPANPLQTFSPY